MTDWVDYGWSDPVYYNYGENVYYDDGSVYYGDQPVATEEEYAQQAEAIATSVPEAAPAAEDWMPLGVFAVTSDGQPTGVEPTMYLQLAVSKQGVINGTFQNTATQCRSRDRRHGRQANAARRLDGRRQVASVNGNRHRQSDAGYNGGARALCRRHDPTMAAGADG